MFSPTEKTNLVRNVYCNVVIALLVTEQMCSVFSEAKIISTAQDLPQWALVISAFSTQRCSTPKLGLLDHCC